MLNKAEVGERLRQLRENLTLQEVADALKVSPATVLLWEQGERTPSDDMKVKISAFYKQPVTVIFFEE